MPHTSRTARPLPVALAALALLAATSPADAQHQPRALPVQPLQVDDVLGVLAFGDRDQVDLSPDAGMVAYALVDPRRAAALTERARYFGPTGATGSRLGGDIYLTNPRTGATRSLTGARGSSWGPAWSPDGRRVLVKLLPADLGLAEAARLLPDAAASAAAPGQTGGRVTAVVFSTMADTGAAGASGRLRTVDASPSFMNAALADLALVEVATGAVRRIARRVRPMAYRFSPDGGRVAFSSRQSDGGNGSIVWGVYDLTVIDTAERRLAFLPRLEQEYGINFSWSPDGRRLAYLHDGALHVAPADGSAPPRRLAREGARFEHEYRAPLWLDDQTLLLARADTLWRASLDAGDITPAGTVAGRRLIDVVAPADAERLTREGAAGSIVVAVADRVTKRAGFRRLDLRTGQAAPLYEDDVALGATDLAYNVDVSRDGRTTVFVAERGSRPAEVWVAEGGLARARTLTELNPAVTRRASGRSRLVQWTGPRGDTLQGALLLPASYEAGRRYPLVVKVYGGSRLSGTLNRFGLQHGIDNLQLLATRGYAVLLPDTPLRLGTPMADLAAAVLPALDTVVAMGVADPERIGSMGHSYGGYSALAVLVQSDRFRAAVSSGGFSDLVSQYAAMREDGSGVGIRWAEQDQGRMGGSPWEHRQRYIENSPFYFLDKVRAPVLLLHGGADHTVQAARAAETFVALRRLGRTAVLVRYDGEGHHPGEWGAANAADYWERIVAWFDRYLRVPQL